MGEAEKFVGVFFFEQRTATGIRVRLRISQAPTSGALEGDVLQHVQTPQHQQTASVLNSTTTLGILQMHTVANILRATH